MNIAPYSFPDKDPKVEIPHPHLGADAVDQANTLAGYERDQLAAPEEERRRFTPEFLAWLERRNPPLVG